MYGGKKGAISINCKTKLETKFAEREKKRNSLENSKCKSSKQVMSQKMIKEKLMKTNYNYKVWL